MGVGDLVRIKCEGDRFSENYIKFMLNTIGEAPQPLGIITERLEEEGLTFYKVWACGGEHYIEKSALQQLAAAPRNKEK